MGQRDWGVERLPAIRLPLAAYGCQRGPLPTVHSHPERKRRISVRVVSRENGAEYQSVGRPSDRQTSDGSIHKCNRVQPPGFKVLSGKPLSCWLGPQAASPSGLSQRELYGIVLAEGMGTFQRQFVCCFLRLLWRWRRSSRANAAKQQKGV